jgi:DNA-binding response OmpR family regulator
MAAMSPLFSSDKPGVLAMDDEPDMLDIIRVALEAEGFQVFTVLDPQAGLEFYEQHWREIQVVLLDYVMPKMTGDLVFECLQRINPAVKVLLLTACEDRVARQMFQAGLRGYIQKPFYLEDLINRVSAEVDGD